MEATEQAAPSPALKSRFIPANATEKPAPVKPTGEELAVPANTPVEIPYTDDEREAGASIVLKVADARLGGRAVKIIDGDGAEWATIHRNHQLPVRPSIPIFALSDKPTSLFYTIVHKN